MELSLPHSSFSNENGKCKPFSRYQRRIPVKPSYSTTAPSQMRAAGSDQFKLNKPSKFINASWNFMRPYSLYGNVVISFSLVIRCWIMENPNLIQWSLLLKAILGLLSLTVWNGYTSGINQIYDIDIDRINKPYLPMVSGELSVESAWLLVTFYAVTGLLIVGSQAGPLLICLYSVALFLATAYSAPPFRLKRFTFGPMLTIVFGRGFLIQYMVSYATQVALGLTFQWTAPLVFMMANASMFVAVMSFVKDLSDVEGDRKYQVSTLATKFGVRNTAFLGSGILLLKYIVGISAAYCMRQAFNLSVIIPTQLIFVLCLIFQAWLLEKKNYTKEASENFYKFIWKLMNAEYLIYPFI